NLFQRMRRVSLGWLSCNWFGRWFNRCVFDTRQTCYGWFQRLLEHVDIFLGKERTQRIRHADETTDGRQHCEDDQRDRHHSRGLMRLNWTMMLIRFLVL